MALEDATLDGRVLEELDESSSPGGKGWGTPGTKHGTGRGRSAGWGRNPSCNKQSPVNRRRSPSSPLWHSEVDHWQRLNNVQTSRRRVKALERIRGI